MILLTHGELVISGTYQIDGPRADLLTIDAAGNDPTPMTNNGDGSRVFNVDARYSRFIPLGRARAELFVEAKNLFNTENVSAVNRVVPVDAAGNPLSPIPDPFAGTAGYFQRQAQLGLKVTF